MKAAELVELLKTLPQEGKVVRLDDLDKRLAYEITSDEVLQRYIPAEEVDKQGVFYPTTNIVSPVGMFVL